MDLPKPEKKTEVFVNKQNIGYTIKLLLTNYSSVHTGNIWTSQLVNNMLLLTNCEVHTGKYLDRSFEVRTSLRSNCGPNISRMDRTNWSIRDLLHSQYFLCLRKPQFCVQVHTGFGRSIRLWTDLGLINQIASFCLAIQ